MVPCLKTDIFIKKYILLTIAVTGRLFLKSYSRKKHTDRGRKRLLATWEGTVMTTLLL